MGNEMEQQLVLTNTAITDIRVEAEALFISLHAKTPNTASTYRAALKHFLTWLQEFRPGLHPFDLGMADAQAWLMWLGERFAKTTQATYGQAVAAFYKFVTDPAI